MDSILLMVAPMIMLVCFSIRVFPRLGRPLVGHDAWAILLVVDELKKGRGYNGVSNYFLIPGDHDYPPLFFYFLSLFPSSWLRRYNWIVNPIFDSVNALLLLLVAYSLTGDVALSVIGAGVYSFTPVVLEESLILSTRSFGMILFNATLASLVLYYALGQPVFLLCTVAGGILVFLSHKFATQVLSLLLVSVAVASLSFLPIVVLMAIIAGAVLSSGGFYVKIAQGHLGIIKFWLRHYKQYGTDYLGKVAPSGRHKKPRTTGVVEAVPDSFLRRLWWKTKKVNPFYWLLSINPFNPFSLVVVLVPFLGGRSAWGWLLVEWSLFTLVFYYAATYLKFLGHYPGRSQFLDYNAFPTAVLCAMFLSESFSSWKAAVVAAVFMLSLIQIARSWSRVRVYNRSNDQSLLEDIFGYLKRSSKDGVVCLPASHTYAVPYFSGKKVFYTMSARNYEKLAAFFPVLTARVDVLSGEYDINFVIVDTMVLDVEALDMVGFKRVMERSGYVLFEKCA